MCLLDLLSELPVHFKGNMSAATFDVLGPEILQLICGYLDPESLSAFALTNRQCSSIADIFLLHTIHITLSNKIKLQQDIDRWMRRLDKTNLKYVRRLEIEGYMSPEQDGSDEPKETKPAQLRKIERYYYSADDVLMDSDSKDHVIFKSLPDKTHYEDSAWQPLVDFLRRLSALADLIFRSADGNFRSSNQFSPYLLDVLHQHHPDCRLHITLFQCMNLPQQNTDPHEIALASSPSLYSISVFLYGVENYGNSGYSEAVDVWWKRYGAAPNLKDIRMFYRPTDVPRLPEAVLDVRTRQLPHDLSSETHQASIGLVKLERLEIHRDGFITLSVLNTFSKYIDFSALHILKLKVALENTLLSWAAANYPFSSLTTLVLEVHGRGWHEAVETQHTDEHHFHLESFLRSLPPLRNLRVSGRFRQNAFDALVEHHGKYLRRLWLEAKEGIRGLVFKSCQVEKIRQHCLILEDLKLDPVPRSKGDAVEAAIYKKFGEMIKLRKLSLILDPFNIDQMWTGHDKPKDTSLDEAHQRHIYTARSTRVLGPPADRDHGYVSDVLINSAIDEILARAIFNTISSRKARDSSPLESLKLSPGGYRNFYGRWDMRRGALPDTLTHMSRSWLLLQSQRDDCRDKVIAWNRHGPESENDRAQYRMLSRRDALSTVEQAYRRLWPGSQDSTGYWGDDWHSWPLSEALDG